MSDIDGYTVFNKERRKMNKADKKVKEYLKRAQGILRENFSPEISEEWKNYELVIIGIAKMIQKEEHYDSWGDR